MTRRDYARAVCVGTLEPNPRDVALNVLVAQMYAESGPALCDGTHGARNNPLNTTLPTRGSQPTTFNSAGVQNYRDPADGVAAVISTLRQQNFTPVRNALMDRSLGGFDVAKVIESSPWGTGKVLTDVLADYHKRPSFYDDLLVGTDHSIGVQA